MALLTFTAGRKVRASELAALATEFGNRKPVAAVKATGENVSTSNTGATLHNDPALFVSLRANTLYWLDLSLLATEAAGTGIDLKAAWTFPSGCRWT